MAPLRRVLVLFVLVLAWPTSASAHTDGQRQLEFSWPADGTVTSPFGQDGGRWHTGLDIGILRSLGVTAAAPGVVTRVGVPRGYEGYGQVVEIDAGDGYSLLYAHLADMRVKVGDYVMGGQHIATAGCTGWCTGTHLHFELRYRGRPLSPLSYLSR
ncbi:MAG: M23 family metallopeptidase [Actinomycetota bacterium]|nr:M23 family metallopeptidase [Actinomycetota bacterium]